MPRPTKRRKHLKKMAQVKKLKCRAEAFKATKGTAGVVRNAIRATPAAVDLMCKLLRLVACRTALLWVGCGCGEEILAILREVRGIYIVALELNKSDLDTFRSTLGAAKGVLPVVGEIDVFRLKSNGAKVRLVCADAGSLSNEQFDDLARPLPITHMFSFAVGPSGWWELHTRLVEYGWWRGVRAVLPLRMWESAGLLPKTLQSIGDVHKASWSTSGANQKFSFVAIDLPAAKPLEVGARVRTRFQDNGKPGPPKDHLIFAGKVLKTSDDGFFVDVRCDRDQMISKRTPMWWVSLVDKAQEKARWTRGA